MISSKSEILTESVVEGVPLYSQDSKTAEAIESPIRDKVDVYESWQSQSEGFCLRGLPTSACSGGSGPGLGNARRPLSSRLNKMSNKCRKTYSQNGLRKYSDILPHQEQSMLSYLEPPN